MILVLALVLLFGSIGGAVLTWHQFRGGTMAPLGLDQLHMMNRVRASRRDSLEFFWVLSILNWVACALAAIAGFVLLPIGFELL
ncbi:hypothetical protein [Sphingomonas immobilis]|uniref:Uncharacterized protein n=1 Tax=Sphingomonas immobilis TaxID=3063997 RepID=A0ABT9A3M2_9SPHN|nr:hypothetical protein [Sphingomonas sp. CA1-15]MDO7844143.1 hypothetical protein [Sphingomonas sp. CA1-15]